MTSPDYLPAEIEQQISNMTDEQVSLLLMRTRPPEESADPQERAAAAVRRTVSGRQPGRPKATPESAAAALARYRAQ